MKNQKQSQFLRVRLENGGFTLIEMLVVVAIVAVILGIAVPNFRQFSLNNKMTGVANDLLTAIHTARTEAIKRQAPVVICFTTTPDAATPACDGNGTQGWVTFVDAVNPAAAAATDNNVAIDTGEEILLRHGALPGEIAVRNSKPAGNAGYISFLPSGFTHKITAIGTPVSSLVLCDSRGNIAVAGADNSAARGIGISDIGRTVVTRSVTQITSAAFGGC